MDPILHTVVAVIAFFLFYLWGLVRGHNIGLDKGLREGSAIATKRTLEFVRSEYDIHITDYDINEASEHLRNE